MVEHSPKIFANEEANHQLWIFIKKACLWCKPDAERGRGDEEAGGGALDMATDSLRRKSSRGDILHRYNSVRTSPLAIL